MRQCAANMILLLAGTDAVGQRFGAASMGPFHEKVERADARELEDCIERPSDEEKSSVLQETPMRDAGAHRSPSMRTSRPVLLPVSAAELMAKRLPDPRFVMSGYIGEGLTILAGRP